MLTSVLVRPRRILFAAAAALAVGIPATAGVVAPAPEEMARLRRWVAEHLDGPDASAPFSFRYAGRPSAGLLKTWEKAHESRELDPTRSERVATYTDRATGLVVRCTAIVYKDFPTVEWTVVFRNGGAAETPILEDVQGLDGIWTGGGGAAVLHHARGSICTAGDYEPFATPLAPGTSSRFGGSAGRPSGDDWPYFNLQQGDAGLIVAVGWPAQWAGTFAAEADGVRIRAGQEGVHAKLLPGEEIRTPLMALQFWNGDRARSQNVWRRWMTAHGMTRPSGAPPPPQFVASSSRAYGEMVHADEGKQLMFIDRYLEEGIKLDAWWMDAGWYVQEQGWPQVGTWEVDAKRFPRGLRAVSDHAHARGLRTIVWFEPERVAPGTWLYENHSEWLLPRHAPGTAESPGLRSWSSASIGVDPVVIANLSDEPRELGAIHVAPRGMTFHPGPDGEFCVVRWTAPEAGDVAIRAAFRAADPKATTDVHVLLAGKPIFEDRVGEKGREPSCDRSLTVARGDAIDFVVGPGGNGHGFDSTSLTATLATTSGATHDAALEFAVDRNPGSAWSYGWLKPGATPDASTFTPFDRKGRPGEDASKLLNLGSPAAREWLTDHVDRTLAEQGVDLYRQDFNIDPLPFWRAADAPDRRGVTENHHVVGYLAYWDELIRRRPGLLIDSCASGGRRNDLETMRRAVPLWRTDYAFQAIADQGMTYGLSPWLPYFGSGTTAARDASYMGAGFSAVDPYAFWSNATPSISCGVDVRERGIDYKTLRTLVGRWRELSRFYYDDFYALTPYSLATDAWIAWQYNAPERREGAVQAFRRQDAPEARIRLKLHGLDADAVYALSTLDATEPREAAGRDLMATGLEVDIPARPAAAVVFYRRRD
ncbi:alpha-galactosidase [Paludisphaera mucosa]|uniref:Alpha-galactosidase n=1 Tax=Paludisphaera mucosa TaxID=3030827 RepID=A0ABT6FHS5_9BACT|nr:alpha-galactosidase [Paludisphaera mucosa]MDG3007143.1 alpha-galactosidase [Paludisphaera mucosa]